MAYFSTAFIRSAFIRTAKVIVTVTIVNETRTNIFLMTAFSEALKRLMEAKRLKQRDLVEGLGVTKQVVSNWFNKGYKPDIDLMPRLAALLSMSTDDFFREMEGKVNDTVTNTQIGKVPVPGPEVYQMQQKISQLQEQLIKYQEKEIESKDRQLEKQQQDIERQRQLSPNQDATHTPQ